MTEPIETRDPEADLTDRLYLSLHGLRESICLWQHTTRDRTLLDLSNDVVRAVDALGSSDALPRGQWSRHDRTHETLPDPDDGWSHGWLDQIPVGSRYRHYRNSTADTATKTAGIHYPTTSVWFCPPPPEPETIPIQAPLSMVRIWATASEIIAPLRSAAREALDAAGLPREKP